ncbi:hypothetical protein G9A89_000540, partial [Geosiphon pyriformis]
MTTTGIPTTSQDPSRTSHQVGHISYLAWGITNTSPGDHKGCSHSIRFCDWLYKRYWILLSLNVCVRILIQSKYGSLIKVQYAGYSIGDSSNLIAVTDMYLVRGVLCGPTYCNGEPYMIMVWASALKACKGESLYPIDPILLGTIERLLARVPDYDLSVRLYVLSSMWTIMTSNQKASCKGTTLLLLPKAMYVKYSLKVLVLVAIAPIPNTVTKVNVLVYKRRPDSKLNQYWIEAPIVSQVSNPASAFSSNPKSLIAACY